MGKYKYLLKNIGLLTISNFATKLLSFFLVPLYTNILTTGEYGTYDLFNTTVGILVPILTLNIMESVLRFTLDKNCDEDAVVTISSKYLAVSSIIVIAILAVNYIFNIIPIASQYGVYFFLIYLSQALSGVVLSYTRGKDHIADLSISSVVASAIIIGCNILFLVVFKWGLSGYFLANVIGPLFQCVYLIYKTGYLKHVKVRKSYKAQQKELIAYSSPLIANSIAWWINGVSDRYVVTFFCGIAANGVYSVASKIPSILNVFQTIFNQAWVLSAVKDFDPEDKSGFFANTYKVYNCLMVVVCSFIIMFDRILAKFLYAKDFYVAWKYVPFLTIAIVFGAISGYIGGFFSAVKDSKVFATSTVVGAVTNIILNIIFTPIMGALGDAIATAICYFEVWLVRLIQSRKYIKLRINLFRDCISYIFLIAQSLILLIMPENLTMYAIQVCFIFIMMILYKNDMILLVNKIRQKGIAR